MRRRLSLTAALVLLLSLLCACAAQHAQEMDENGYELYFLSDPSSAGGGDAIRPKGGGAPFSENGLCVLSGCVA